MEYEISKDKKVITCDILGAVFIYRSTFQTEMRIFPASVGLRKGKGCVSFHAVYGFWSRVEREHCKRVYYDTCPGSSAWLVVPQGKVWLWIQVDGEIDFS